MHEWAIEDSTIGTEYVVHFRGKHAGRIKRTWRTALKNAGVARRVRPYDLRHAFAAEVIAVSVDVGTVVQLMGHDPKMLLDHYQHVADKQKISAVEALPEIPDYGKNYGNNAWCRVKRQ